MKKITVTGKSIEDAVNEGLEQLKATKDQVKIHIIDQPSKGLFGLIGVKEAKVELELTIDPLEETIQFLSHIFQLMQLDVTIEKEEEEEAVTLNLSGSELGILIGRRGQTLDALQYLTNIIANRYSNTHLRLILDAENFRLRRKKTLQQLALRLADRVIKTDKEVILEPMSALERKVIHSFLQDHPKVKTYSKGVEPNRRVVIELR
jgi:spoIIIJ-associated protein